MFVWSMQKKKKKKTDKSQKFNAKRVISPLKNILSFILSDFCKFESVTFKVRKSIS